MLKKNILVLGVGNILLADEGFGVHAVEFLRKNYTWPDNFTLLDGGTRGLMLMSDLMDCDMAIVLDIALNGKAPGTMYLMEGDEIDQSFSCGCSMHQTGINDVLASCELAGHKPEILVFGMEPFDYQTLRPELTEEAKKKLPLFCGKVVEQLKQKGLLPSI